MLKPLLGIMLSVCLASPALAITFDVASSSEGTTSTSHSHTVAADADIAIICVAQIDGGAGVAVAQGVTIGGQAATLLPSSGASPENVVRTEIWYKLAPLTGAQTVAVTSGATTDFTVTGVMTFKDVAQSSTFGTAVTATGTSNTNADVNTIGSAVGEQGVYCGAFRTSATTASPDSGTPVSVERYEDGHTDASGPRGFGYTEDGAVTSIDMQVDLSTSGNWAAAAVSMRPVAGASSFGPLRRRY